MRLRALLFVAMVASACGAEGQSQLVKAGEGAKLSLERAALDIPAQSLAQDTKVSMTIKALSEFPQLANARPDVVVVEPLGTKLTKGAIIRLDAGADAKGKSVLVHELVEGDGLKGWRALERSTIVTPEGLAETSIDRFGVFAVVVRSIESKVGKVRAMLLDQHTEKPVANQTVKLLQGTQEIKRLTSDAQGLVLFETIPVGNYKVKLELAGSCISTTTPEKDAIVAEAKTTELFFGISTSCK